MLSGVSKTELLDYLVQIEKTGDNIDLDSMCAHFEMQKRNKSLLAKHTHKIWQATDGTWCTYLPDHTRPKNRKLIRKHTEMEVQNVVINYWLKESEPKKTLREVFTAWNERRAGLEQIALSTKDRMVQDADRYFDLIQDQSIDSFTEEGLIDYIERCVTRHSLTPKAFTNLKTLFRGTFKYARRNKLTAIDIESVIDLLQVPPRQLKHNEKADCEEVFDEDEFVTLVNYLISNIDIRNMALLTIMLTGVRPGEIVTRKHSDIIRG